jgi:hypothetical protein
MTVYKAAKRAGEKVQLRTDAGQWVTAEKPKCRRGKHYLGHVRAVALQLDRLAVSPSVANFKRMGVSRRSKLKRALAQLAIEEITVTPPTVTENK